MGETISKGAILRITLLNGMWFFLIECSNLTARGANAFYILKKLIDHLLKANLLKKNYWFLKYNSQIVMTTNSYAK